MADRNRFDDWLESRLRVELGPPGAAPPSTVPAYARLGERRRLRLPLLAGVGAALASKGATGFAMTAFAVGLTGAAAVQTVTTGSPVPPPVEVRLRAVAQDIGAVAPAPAAAQAVAQGAERPITPLPEAGPSNSPARPASGPPPAPVRGGSEPARVDGARPQPPALPGQGPALAPAGSDGPPPARPSAKPTASASPTPGLARSGRRPATAAAEGPSERLKGSGHPDGDGGRDGGE